MKTGFLRCDISEGQFTDEYAVDGKAYNDESFSLFAGKSDLRCDRFPDRQGDVVEGGITVDILDEQEGLMLVKLPKRTLENGDVFTVRADQVENIQIRSHQKA